MPQTPQNQWYGPWLGAGSPYRLVRPAEALRINISKYGITVYHYPDKENHLWATHPQDHTPYSETKWPIGAPGIDGKGRALDVMPRSDSYAHRKENADIARRIIWDKDAGVAGTEWIKYLNWTDENGVCRNENWKSGRRVTSPSTDRGHIHISGRSDMDNDSRADSYDPVARMTGADMADLNSIQATVDRIEQGSIVPTNALIYWVRAIVEGRASAASGGTWPGGGLQGPDKDGIPEVLAAIAALPPPAALTDEQFAALLVQLDATLRDIFATKGGELLEAVAVSLAPRLRVSFAPPE